MPESPKPTPLPLGPIISAFMQSDDPEMPTRAFLLFLLAFMCWPQKKDRHKIQALIAIDYFWLLDLLKSLPHDPDASTLPRVHGLGDRIFGGWQQLPNLLCETDTLAEFQRRLIQGKQAGAALCAAHILYTHHNDQKRSLRRVYAFLARNKNSFLSPPPSVDALKTAWETSQSAAHLWAGLFFVEHWMSRQVADAAGVNLTVDVPLTAQPRKTVEAIAPYLTRSMLAMAVKFQDFGTACTSKHAHARLLDRDRIWVLQDVPASPIPCPDVRLTDDDLGIYIDY